METDRFKGVNKATSPHLLEDGELTDMRNLFADRSSLTKRPGQTRLHEITQNQGHLMYPLVIINTVGSEGVDPLLPVDGYDTVLDILHIPSFAQWST